MKPLTCRNILPVLLLCVTLNSNASGTKNYPGFFNETITDSLLKSVLNPEKEKTNSKICACQLLDVESNNEKLRNVVVFAEKTNYGVIGNVQQVMLNALQKERKNMQYFFYSKVKVKKEFIVRTDCASLYLQLKEIYGNLKMYDVIDVDVWEKL